MNKKGTIIDSIYIVVILLALSVGILFFHFVNNSVHNALLQSQPINNTVEARQALTAIDKVNDRLDYLYFFVGVGLFMSMVIFSWFISGYAILSFIYFLLLCIIVIISAVAANTWEMISSQVVFINDLAALPLTNSMMSNLPYWTITFGLLSLLVLFAKPGLGRR